MPSGETESLLAADAAMRHSVLSGYGSTFMATLRAAGGDSLEPFRRDRAVGVPGNNSPLFTAIKRTILGGCTHAEHYILRT